LIGKFPDLFCGAVISCGISDYGEWYKGDSMGEFRDEMLLWIGYTPEQNPEAYQSRSGITTVNNILTPIYVVHGETDIRVPVTHSRNFVQKGKEYGKNINYLELENVGTRDHWENITDKQMIERTEFSHKGLEICRPPKLPV
jgi:dipeptidyl aminopeptidase/acylaminoacyl peptidase